MVRKLAGQQGVDASTRLMGQDLSKRIAALEVSTAWTDVTFQNSWVNFDAVSATQRRVQYMKEGHWVSLRGVMSGGTLAATAFALPVGFRPTYLNHVFPVVSNSLFGTITVEATGNVIPTGSNVWVFLDGVTYWVP